MSDRRMEGFYVIDKFMYCHFVSLALRLSKGPIVNFGKYFIRHYDEN